MSDKKTVITLRLGKSLAPYIHHRAEMTRAGNHGS